MKKFIKENWFKILLSTIGIFVGISVMFYFLVLLPKQQQLLLDIQNKALEIEQQKVELTEEGLNVQKQTQTQAENLINKQQKLLNNCLENERIRFKSVWDNYLNNDAPEATRIPTTDTQNWGILYKMNEETHTKTTNDCYQRFPQ